MTSMISNTGSWFSPPRQAAQSGGKFWRLEALRGFAAFYVLLHHVSSSYLHLKHTIWGFPFRFGQEAVLVFFLLSGFVICYSHRASGDFKSYFIKRGRRIYPIFTLSLLLGYLVMCIGEHRLIPVNWGRLAGNLLMMQDHPERPGWSVMPFADNMPLWSLSFEWWFYLMFYPINRWVPAARQKYFVFGLTGAGMLVNLVWPNCFCWYLVFFVIWWTGVEMAREFSATQKVTWRRQKAMAWLLGLPLLWFGVISLIWWWRGENLYLITFPLVEVRYFLMSLVFLGLFFAWQKVGFVGFDRTIGRFAGIGLISYGLYLLHYPLLMHLRLFANPDYYYLDLALRVGLGIFLAWLAEGVMQKWINHHTNRWLKSARELL